MINIQKRFAKIVTGTLAAVLVTYAFVPAAAFAAYHHLPPPPRPVYHSYHPHHHYRDYGRWTKRDTATLAGLAAIIGLLALANNKRHDTVLPAMTDVTSGTQNAAVVYNSGMNGQIEAPDFAVQVLRLVNAERAKVGARPLRLSRDLMNAAGIRAEEISRHFAHVRPDGSSCFTVLRDRNRLLGENIGAGVSTAGAAVDMWMHSEGHRSNILNKNYTELGIGHIYKPNSSYGHYWVQMFRG